MEALSSLRKFGYFVEYLADGVACPVFLCWRTRREIAMDNLLQSRVCATPAEARHLALAAFRNFTYMVVETIVARRRITDDNWNQHAKLQLSLGAEKMGKYHKVRSPKPEARMDQAKTHKLKKTFPELLSFGSSGFGPAQFELRISDFGLRIL